MNENKDPEKIVRDVSVPTIATFLKEIFQLQRSS